MKGRLPRKSELPWFWRPAFTAIHVVFLVVVAGLIGLAHYQVPQIRAAGAPLLSPVAAWGLYTALFILGVGIGLLGARSWLRWFKENWELRLEHYHRYGWPWWKSLVAGFTREFWRSALRTSGPAGGRWLEVALISILVFWGSAVCGGAIEYAITREVGAGPGIAFFGSLVGLQIPFLRMIRRLDE